MVKENEGSRRKARLIRLWGYNNVWLSNSERTQKTALVNKKYAHLNPAKLIIVKRRLVVRIGGKGTRPKRKKRERESI